MVFVISVASKAMEQEKQDYITYRDACSPATRKLDIARVVKHMRCNQEIEKASAEFG